MSIVSSTGEANLMDLDFVNKLTEECISHYQRLPKKGKPIPNKEWTLLSAIVKTFKGKCSVVSMATGTKCLGRSGMTADGQLVNDSHAEVLARRCFLRYLYDQIHCFKKNATSDIIISSNEENKFKINPEIKFHLYTSHVPCGDASIIPKIREKRKLDINECKVFKQKKVEDDNYHQNKQQQKLLVDSELQHSSSKQSPENLAVSVNKDSCTITPTKNNDDCIGDVLDIYRTGARCVTGKDEKCLGPSYHIVGVVRTKPGRGDPTLSVSCSDKMSRWIACGLQGALLSLMLTEPVFLDSVVVGGGGPYSADVMKRSLIERTCPRHPPQLEQSSHVFPHSRYLASSTAKPCPSAILWSDVSHKSLEVCVEGRRQGTTKKCRDSGRLMVCKLELLRNFLSVAGDKYKGMTYRDIKASSGYYNSTWAQTKNLLGVWTEKPEHLEHFTLP